MSILSVSQKIQEPCPKIQMEIEAGALGENLSLPKMNQESTGAGERDSTIQREKFRRSIERLRYR